MIGMVVASLLISSAARFLCDWEARCFLWETVGICRYAMGLVFCCFWLCCGLSLGFDIAWGYASLSVFGSIVSIMCVHGIVECVFYHVSYDIFPALDMDAVFFDSFSCVAGCCCRQGDGYC